MRTKIILIGSVLLMMAGCSLGGPKFPIGDYLDSEGYLTTFHTRGRYWVRSTKADEVQTTHGYYTLDGDMITFAVNALCPEGEGVYIWTFEGDQLIFELIEDDCDSRIEALSRDITKYKYGE